MMKQTTKRVRSPERQDLDCKTVGFFLKISKEIGKAWRKSLTRLTRQLSVFSLVADLLFDGSRVLEYATIRTVLQSRLDFTH